MSASFLPEISSLSVAERLQLVEQIWDSIVNELWTDRLDEKQPFPLTGWQKAELDRRLSLHDSHPERGAAWDVVKARILGE